MDNDDVRSKYKVLKKLDIEDIERNDTLSEGFHCPHTFFCAAIRSRDALLRLKEHELREEKKLERGDEEVTKKLFEIISTFLVSHNVVLNIYTEKISKIEEVEAVYVFSRDKVIDIWTIIKDDDFDVKRKIVEVQGEIVDLFQEVLLFDFLILSKEDIESDQSLLENCMEIYRK